MRTLRKQQHIRFHGNKDLVRAEIDVDDFDELPEVEDIDGLILAQGSTAHVINDGALYELNGEGEWKKQGG